MERELHCLPMSCSIRRGIPEINLPDGFKIIHITESNGHLWEAVMEDAYNEIFLPGTFRSVMVSHPNYNEGQVYVMLNEKKNPSRPCRRGLRMETGMSSRRVL